MSIAFNIGGTPVPANSVRLVGGVQGLTSVADGSVGTGAWEVDDPTGAYTFLELALAIVTESACSQPRTHTGYIYNVAIKRGPYVTGPGRVHTFDVGDLNFLMHLRVFHAADAKRPLETGAARVAWLLASVGLTGLVYDNGLVMNNTANFGAADYRGQYADQVLQDICATGGGLNPIFFVYWDPSAAQPSLFYNLPTVALHDSTLSISNVNADRSSTCFVPSKDAELSSAGEDIYDGVYFEYITGKIYRQLPSTFTTFGLHRDGTFSTDRIGLAATASSHVDYYLANHSGQLDTITCTVQLPAASVNLIDAGMRLQVKFSHLPGYTSFTYTRVVSRTVILSDGTNELYDVQLKLSVKGINQVGGGDPGAFPAPPGCSVASMGFVQISAAAASSSVVFAATPIVGNILYWFSGNRTSGQTWTPTVGTWTLLDSESCDQNVAGDFPTRIYYKFVEATDTATIALTPAPTGGVGWMVEFSGQLTFGTSNKAKAVGNVGLVSLAPAAGKVALLVSLEAISDDSVGWPRTPASGMTELIDDNAGGPQLAINYQIVTLTSGSYSVGSTESSHPFANSSVIGAAFYCSGEENPPMPGQWIYGEVVTPAPDGSTVTFTTAFPFADGSLTVYVDNLDQTAAVSSYDGAAGTFTLSFAPWGTDTVTVDYQGR